MVELELHALRAACGGSKCSAAVTNDGGRADLGQCRWDWQRGRGEVDPGIRNFIFA
jgi:hypothetical protein